MTPEEHDPEQETVRRLLAAAGGPEPVPDEVGARLDDVLAGLVAERQGVPEQPGPEPRREAAPAPVISLTARRRRRWAQALVAAAVVSVVAVGVGTALKGGQADSENAASGGPASVTAEDKGLEGTGGGTAGAAPEGRSAGKATDSFGAAQEGGQASVTRLSSGSLTRQVQEVENFALAVPVPTSDRWADACARPRTGSGDEWLPVRFDGRPGVLVLRAPVNGRRQAEVYTCGSRAPVASTTVRAR